MEVNSLVLSRCDVIRIVERDFAGNSVPLILALLDSVNYVDDEAFRSRIQMAILKLSDRNVNDIQKFLGVARIDARDVLASAESPRLLHLGPIAFESLESTSPDEIVRLEALDRHDYENWLRRGPTPEQ